MFRTPSEPELLVKGVLVFYDNQTVTLEEFGVSYSWRSVDGKLFIRVGDKEFPLSEKAHQAYEDYLASVITAD